MTNKKIKKLKIADYFNPSLKDSFVKDLYESFQNTGFVVIQNDQVPIDLIEKAYNLQEQFFSLPVSIKQQYIMNNNGQRGYTPFATEHAKGFHVKDLKEFFHIGREDVLESYPLNIPVKEIDDFDITFNHLFKKLEKTGDIILEALTYSMNLPPDFFKNGTKQGNSVLRLLHYPPIPEHIEKDQIRAQAHTDINLITCLLAGKGQGLQLLTKEHTWEYVESDPYSIVINMGDMLSRMTNGILPSTVHRVNNPEGENHSRYSMPFFIHPQNNFILKEIPKYKNQGLKEPEITAGDFLNLRLKEIGLKK